jgi:hypothetical protein
MRNVHCYITGKRKLSAPDDLSYVAAWAVLQSSALAKVSNHPKSCVAAPGLTGCGIITGILACSYESSNICDMLKARIVVF